MPFNGASLTTALHKHHTSLTKLYLVPWDNDLLSKGPLPSLSFLTSLKTSHFHWTYLQLLDADGPSLGEMLPQSIEDLGIWLSIADSSGRLSLEHCLNEVIHSFSQLPKLRLLNLEHFTKGHLVPGGVTETFDYQLTPLTDRLIAACNERNIELGPSARATQSPRHPQNVGMETLSTEAWIITTRMSSR